MSVRQAADLVYVYCNMRLMHKPQSIATRATEPGFGCLQTHAAIADDLQSDNEMECNVEDFDIQCSDVKIMDDLVPILDINDDV